MSSTDIRLIQLNSYVRPTLVENKYKNWVLNGKNNVFYQYVIDRFNGSPTNAAIINTYIDLIYGRGLNGDNIEVLNDVISDRELRKIIADFQLFGEASIQVIKKRNKKELPQLLHIAKNKVVPEIEDEEGNINGYWYCENWNKQAQNPPVYYPAFGTSSEAIEIFNIKPYKAGKNYFSDPDYLAGLPYAEIEEEIANYCVNHIQNGLSFGYIVNIPDGINWTAEEREKFERQLKGKLSGTNNAGKFVLSFNGRDTEVKVTPIEVNSAHKQWDFLVQEARQQLITAHRVTSPMLFGIKDSTGLGNNADELDTAERQLYKRVIAPKQKYLTDALEEIMDAYNVELELEFLPLTEYEEEVEKVVKEVEEKDVVDNDNEEVVTELKKNILDELGEYEDLDNWDLIDERKVDYEEEEKIDLQLARTGTARSNAKSKQDGESEGYNYKVRYQYAPLTTSEKSRDFCTKMVQAKKIYRKEDIVMMGNQSVNAGWGAKGADTYDIWLYKGGGDCHHFWMRKTYRSKKPINPDAKNPNSEVSVNKAKKDGFKPEVNDKKVAKLPTDMPYNGFLPTNKRFQ